MTTSTKPKTRERERNPGEPAHIGEGGLLVPPFGEQLLGGVEDVLTAAVGVSLPFAGFRFGACGHRPLPHPGGGGRYLLVSKQVKEDPSPSQEGPSTRPQTTRRG